ARMRFKTNTIERSYFRVSAGKLWNARKATLIVSLFPNEEHLVNGVESINLELVVAVFASNKEFDIIVLIDRRISLGESRRHVGFFHPVCDIEMVVVPEQSCSCVVQCRLTTDEIDKAGRTRSYLPAGFIENAIDSYVCLQTV